MGLTEEDVYPSEHFIVAFLPMMAYVVVRDKRLPSPRFIAIVFLGSQFPDLIDKPLAYQVGIIPSGRVFGHSLPVALPFLFVVGLYGWQTDRSRLSVAFVFGYLSHLFADNYTSFLKPNPQFPSDLLWPFAPPIPRSSVPHWAGPGGVNVELWTLFSLVVLSITVYAFITDVRKQFSTNIE